MKINARIIIIVAPAIVRIMPHGNLSGGISPGPAGTAEAIALQLVELLTLGSAVEVAVTVMVVVAPTDAQLGTVTVSVTPSEVPSSRVSEVAEILGDHAADPEILRSKVSVASPVFMTVTV